MKKDFFLQVTVSSFIKMEESGNYGLLVQIRAGITIFSTNIGWNMIQYMHRIRYRICNILVNWIRHPGEFRA